MFSHSRKKSQFIDLTKRSLDNQSNAGIQFKKDLLDIDNKENFNP